MKILLIDSVSAELYVALVYEKSVVEKVFATQRQHDRNINRLVKEILQDEKTAFSDLDAFAVVTGHGSWTGSRVGVAAVKAYAMVTGKPIIALTKPIGTVNSVNVANDKPDNTVNTVHGKPNTTMNVTYGKQNMTVHAVSGDFGGAVSAAIGNPVPAVKSVPMENGLADRNEITDRTLQAMTGAPADLTNSAPKVASDRADLILRVRAAFLAGEFTLVHNLAPLYDSDFKITPPKS